MIKVLIVEQSKSVRNNLIERLSFEGYQVDGVASIENLQQKEPCDIFIIDSPISEVPHHLAGVPFIVISKDSSIEVAAMAQRCGAIDFLTKPIDLNRLLALMRSAVAHNTVESKDLDPDLPSRVEKASCRRRDTIAVEEMVGKSIPMIQLRNIINKVAPSDARVMILGENGTGKEMVAKLLHCKSHRSKQPFIEINCAAIPSELIESELFGHEKGAFTSAIKMRRGKFEQADGGTLFMDEIGDMSLSAQAKVLRALQERKICRVGSDKDIDVDVRVVAATNKDIKAEIAAGNFREDLYHRLAVIELRVVPLRQRREDIPLLIECFLKKICTDYKVSPQKTISQPAMNLLKEISWSGNIRELRNVVERLVILSNDSEIQKSEVETYCQVY